MCKEGYKKGTGFFLYIDNKYIPFNRCLMTSNHVLSEYDIKSNKKIHINYQNKDKEIIINEKRKVFTDNDLGYTCVEVLKEDNIKQYFEMNKNINNINSFINDEIIVLQHEIGQYGMKLSFSRGLIISIKDNKILHNALTFPVPAGSIILSRYNLSVIGLHLYINREEDIGSTINSIVNDIAKKCSDI